MPTQDDARLRDGLVPVVLLGALWGLSVAAARVALQAGLPPLLFAVLETALITTICAIAVAVRRRWVAPDSARRRLWVVNGLLLVVIPYVVSYTALTRLTAGEVTVVLALAPVLTSLVAVGVRTESADPWVAAGAVVALAGIVVVATAQTPDGADPSSTGHQGWWVLAAVIAPLCYAIDNVYVVSRPAAVVSDPLLNAFGTNVVGFVVLSALLAAAAASDDLTPATVQLDTAVPFLLLAAGANVAANLLFFVTARRTTASVLGLAGYLTTVFGIGFGVAVAHDPFSSSLLLGAALVLVGVFVGTRRRVAA